LSGFKALEFQSAVPSKDIFKEKELSSKYVFSSRKWHSENLIRNESFKETIQKSKYMSRMFKSEFEYQSLNLLTSAATGLVLTTGIALGVGIVGGGIYLLAQTKSSEGIGEIVAFGFLVGSKIYEAGITFYDSTQSKIQTERKDFQDISRFYRYVRFPDYFILETEPKATPKRPPPFLKIENTSGKINLYFEP
jgi:hypothetical protein